MGSADGGSGGAWNGGGDCGTGGDSGAGGTGAGFSSAPRVGYRDAKKWIAYAGKKTMAGTLTRASREISRSSNTPPKIIAKLNVGTIHPIPAGLPGSTANPPT